MRQVTSVNETDLTNTVLYFTAPWCGPCRVLGPMMDKIAESRENVQFLKVDVDEAPELAQEYRITSVPNVKLFVNGEVKKEFAGLQNRSAYDGALNEYFGD